MKKLMVAVAVALAAVALNAANVNWNVSNATKGVGVMEVAEGWAVYVFADSATSIGSQSIYTRSDLITALGDGSFDFSKAISDKEYIGAAANAGGIGTSFGAGTDAEPNYVNVYAVLVNSDDISTATQAYVSEIRTAAIKASGEGSASIDMLGSYTGAEGDWVAVVPEPTSGLLLLLGVAGLALRRRRA